MSVLESDLNYDEWYLKIAKTVSERSKDPSTKVGAVIVNGKNQAVFGYNGFPRGVKDLTHRWNRPFKYHFVVHAEQNAIINGSGLDLEDSTIYLTHYPPCQNCAKLIVQSGIKNVVCADNRISKNSDPECVASKEILKEGGVTSVIYKDKGVLVDLYDILEQEGL